MYIRGQKLWSTGLSNSDSLNIYYENTEKLNKTIYSTELIYSKPIQLPLNRLDWTQHSLWYVKYRQMSKLFLRSILTLVISFYYIKQIITVFVFEYKVKQILKGLWGWRRMFMGYLLLLSFVTGVTADF